MSTIILDIETDNFDPLTPKLVGFAYKIIEDGIEHEIMYGSAEDINIIKEVLESPKWLKICHNLKFEMSYLKSLGINMCPPYFDTMIAAWILNMGDEKIDTAEGLIVSYKLKDLESLWFATSRDSFKAMAKKFAVSVPTKRIKKDGTPSMRKRDALSSEIFINVLSAYCKKDVEGTFALYKLFIGKMDTDDWNVMDVQMKLIPIYAEMERNGVSMDVPYLQNYEKVITSILDKIQVDMGTLFNLSSPKQVAEFLYVQLELPVLSKSKKLSTDKWTIKKLIKKCPEHKKTLKNILEHRTWRKYRDTYIRNWIKNIHSFDGKVHFSINPIGAHSGRISSPSQQIPKRTDKASDIRKGIMASPGKILCAFDYSQIEPRIMAHFSGEPKLLDIFNSNKDIYKYVVGAALSISPDEVIEKQRDIGKKLVLAINYGQTAWGLSDDLEIPLDEAQLFLNNYFIEFPRVKQYQTEIILEAKRTGFIRTIGGSKRKISSYITLPKKWGKNRYGQWVDSNRWKRAEAERQALNLPIQGSAADIIKSAMIIIVPILHPSIELLLQLHDDLLFEMPESSLKTAVPAIKDIMENVVKLKVPIPVTVTCGQNLGCMKEI